MHIPTEPIGKIDFTEARLAVKLDPTGGVISPIDRHVETAEEARDRVLEAARFVPVDQLGTTDHCGFAPFCDDLSTTRDVAFAKIKARVVGTTWPQRMLEGPSDG